MLGFFLSTANWVSGLVALSVAALGLFGIIPAGWPLLALGCWACGLALFYRPAPVIIAPLGKERMSAEQGLEWCRNAIRALPANLSLSLEEAVREGEELLPRAKALRAQGQSDLARTGDVEAIFIRHLPEAVQPYLNLPARLREMAGPSGKTPSALLSEQMDLIISRLGQARVAYYSNDVTELTAHGNFLKEKFGEDLLSTK